jgi:hypothetical protein
MTTEGNAARPRRRQAAKASGTQDAKVKLTLYLPPELAKRFAVHAEMTDLDRSELFAEMVESYCRRFVVHDHARKVAGEQGEAGAA